VIILKMKKIIEGVHRVGEVRNPRGVPLIVVHPWFRDGESYQPFKVWAQNWRNGKGDYLKNLDSLISSSRGKRPLILLEQDYDMAQSVEKISSLFGTDDFYVVETLPSDCDPRFDREGATQFLAGFGSRALLAGGYVLQTEEGYEGCLGCFKGNLRDIGIGGSFADGCCFTWPS
jgi:hypothetical protein